LTLGPDGVEPTPKAGDLSRASFDYCGGTFRREGSRVERYSVTAGFVEPQSGSIFNEIVRYRSAADARAALDEFRTAVRDCDEGSHPSVITDGKDATFRPSERSAHSSANGSEPAPTCLRGAPGPVAGGSRRKPDGYAGTACCGGAAGPR
jgi:hypothetical protein